eukprot:IDg11147t1
MYKLAVVYSVKDSVVVALTLFLRFQLSVSVARLPYRTSSASKL